MELTRSLRGAAVAAALFTLGCTAPQVHAGWFEQAAARHDDEVGFPGAAAILDGFDEPRPNDDLERGDRALYGLRLGDETYLVLLEMEDVLGSDSGSVEYAVALESHCASKQPMKGSFLSISEPRSRRLAATVFDSTGARISRDHMPVAPTLFCTGLAAGCASEGEYAAEQRRQVLGDATRRVLMAWAACGEFLWVIRRSDSLRSLLEKAVAVNLWSILRSFSVKVSTWPRTREAVPHGEGYRFPLTILINGDPGLSCSVLVTEPHSPLNVGAGVLSIVGIRPGERSPSVTLRLLAARRGSRISR